MYINYKFLLTIILFFYTSHALSEICDVELSGNFDHSAATNLEFTPPYSFQNLSNLSNFQYSIGIITQFNKTIDITIYFVFINDSSVLGKSVVAYLFADGKDIEGGIEGIPFLLGKRKLIFTNSRLIENENGKFLIKFKSKGVFTTQSFNVNLSNFTFYDSANTISSSDSQCEDSPIKDDFDGDKKKDLYIFRPAEANWYIRKSTGGSRVIQWGLPGDHPIVGDYTGDGKSDFVVWRPINGTWYVCRSEDDYDCFKNPIVKQYGLLGDKPLHIDYDKDEKDDFAVYRPNFGIYYINKSTDNTNIAVQWGLSDDIPANVKSN